MAWEWGGKKGEEKLEQRNAASLPCCPLQAGTCRAHLDGHVVDVEAEGDALVKGQLGLPGGIDVDHFL